MSRRLQSVLQAAAILVLGVLLSSCAGGKGAGHSHGDKAAGGTSGPADVPPPDAGQAQVPDGFRVEVVVKNLTYPSSVEFDSEGNVYVAEAGYSYGDVKAQPRLLRVSPSGQITVVATDLSGPVNDLLWHERKMYVSHRGRISVLDGSGVRNLVTGLPSEGDHHNNQLTVGPEREAVLRPRHRHKLRRRRRS